MDRVELEKVQKSDHNGVTGLRGPSWEERLQHLGLISPERCPKEGGIDMHKVMQGPVE